MNKSAGPARSGMASGEKHGSGTRAGCGLRAASADVVPCQSGSARQGIDAYRINEASRPTGTQHLPTLGSPLELHDLRWLDVPLDIYRLVVEQCSVKTLYNLCLVSKLSREFATPILYRCVDLSLSTIGGEAVLACLRHLISSTSAKYCKELRLDIAREWWFLEEMEEPPESQLLLDSAIMCLAEFAIERMPKLKTLRWKGITFPEDTLMRALQKCPDLVNVRLTSDVWEEKPKPGIGAFAHLKSLRVKGITSAEGIHEVRHVIENSPGLEILHLKGCDDFVELDLELPLLDLLLCPQLSGEGVLGGKGRTLLGRSLKELTLVDFFEILTTHMTERGLFSDIVSSAFGHLDCLTLYDIDSRLLSDIGICTGLRLRKLRARCPSWRPLTELLSCSELELLHIELRQPGFDYDSLIPLVCKSKEKLRELRLERSVRSAEQETLSCMMARELVVNCLHLQHLSLRADFASGVWNELRNVFAVSLSDLVSFKLQRTCLDRGSPSQSRAAANEMREPLSWYYLEWGDAQEFATAFVRAAKSAAYEEGKSVADEDIRVNLKYVGIGGIYSEIWMKENKYVISKLDKVGLVTEGVFHRDRLATKFRTLFRVSQTD